jgi:hypothetical protein
MVTSFYGKAERRFTDDGRVRDVIVRGAKLTEHVASAVTSGNVSLSTSEVSQITLTLEDPGDRLRASGLFDVRGSLDYLDLKFVIAALETVDVDGVPGLTVTGRSLGAHKLRTARGRHTWRGISYSTLATIEGKRAKLRVVVEPSAKRRTITRGADDAGQSTWDVLADGARQLGYLLFEAAGVLYFGRPTWLLARQAERTMIYARRSEHLRSRPSCRRTIDDPARAATVDLELGGELGDYLRPGGRLALYQEPGFSGTYIIDSVDIPLDDESSVAVSCSTAINPEPDPEDDKDSRSRSGGDEDDGRRYGNGTAGRMVQLALAQAGDRYVYGAEASSSDPDPDAFDCSELVEWATKRAGGSIPDGSSNQLAAVKRISVAQGKRTRGALLFHPGHVAISLGDGRTIEAMNRRYGVRKGEAGNRFSAAGLIRTLDY